VEKALRNAIAQGFCVRASNGQNEEDCWPLVQIER
jgi:hypothetical protein